MEAARLTGPDHQARRRNLRAEKWRALQRRAIWGTKSHVFSEKLSQASFQIAKTQGRIDRQRRMGRSVFQQSGRRQRTGAGPALPRASKTGRQTPLSRAILRKRFLTRFLPNRFNSSHFPLKPRARYRGLQPRPPWAPPKFTKRWGLTLALGGAFVALVSGFLAAFVRETDEPAKSIRGAQLESLLGNQTVLAVIPSFWAAKMALACESGGPTKTLRRHFRKDQRGSHHFSRNGLRAVALH